MNILAWLGQRATAALAVGGVAGFAVPSAAEFLRGFLPLLVFVFTAVSFLKVDPAAIAGSWQRSLLVALLLVWCLIASPLLVSLAFVILPLPEDLEQVAIIWAASPPMTAAIVFTIFLRLDVSLAVSGSLIATLVVPVTGPPLCLLLAGLPVEVGGLMLSARVAMFIGAAAGAAWVVRAIIGGERIARRSDQVSGLIVLILVAYAASLTAGVGERLATETEHVVLFIAFAFALNIATQALTGLLFARSDMLQGATAALLAGNRNMSVLCANLGPAATPDIMLFFAANHVPIYTLPWLLRRMYAWVGQRNGRYQKPS